MDPVFVKAVNPKGVLYALGAFAGGVAVILFGAIGNTTLAIGKLELPGWSMYVAGALIIGLGVLLLTVSLDSQKCSKCGAFAEAEEAYFPLEMLAQVVEAVEGGHSGPLVNAPKVPKNQMKSVLHVTYCPGCEQAAVVEVTKWEHFQPHDVLPKRPFEGPAAAGFASVVKAHAEWRGEDE